MSHIPKLAGIIVNSRYGFNQLCRRFAVEQDLENFDAITEILQTSSLVKCLNSKTLAKIAINNIEHAELILKTPEILQLLRDEDLGDIGIGRPEIALNIIENHSHLITKTKMSPFIVISKRIFLSNIPFEITINFNLENKKLCL